MTCDEARRLARWGSMGTSVGRREKAALEAHLAECAACRGEVRFERVLAETLREAPTVAAPPSFADNVLAALPPPVVLPAPSLWSLWGWLVGGLALAAGSAFGMWHWRDLWLGWMDGWDVDLAMQSVRAQLGWQYLLNELNRVLGLLTASSTMLTAVALIAVAAWGATVLAGERR